MSTFTGRPAVSGDDGCSKVGFININWNYVYIGDDTVAPFDSFFRVPNVGITQAANIISAKLTCKAFDNRAVDTVRMNIYMNDEDNAVAPTLRAQHAAKSRTTAFAVWDGEEHWVTDNLYDTPDFAAAVQEVVDRGSWAAGNALMILIDDDGSDSGAIRLPDSQDLGETTATLLTIEWEPSWGGGVIFV